MLVQFTQPWRSELILTLWDFQEHFWCVAAPLPTPSRYSSRITLTKNGNERVIPSFVDDYDPNALRTKHLVEGEKWEPVLSWKIVNGQDVVGDANAPCTLGHFGDS